jgi:cellobiose phosphorylase
MNKYGHFSADGSEFIITRPDTPAPWVNYMTNGRYHGLISHTGGGFSFYVTPKDSRITRWRYNGLPMDRPGRYIMLRNKKTGEYWSPTWQPTATKLDSYECRHGKYYTRITTSYHGMHASVLFFVTPDDSEIWQITLTNQNTAPIDLDIFSFVELALGHALVDLINQPNDQHFNDVHFNHENEVLFATKRYWVTYSGPTVKQANQSWDRYVYFASSLPVKGWDGSKNNFIGRWRSESNPEAVERGQCFNTEITAGDAVAALQSELTLAPGETKTFAIQMGIIAKDDYPHAAFPVIEKYRHNQQIELEFNKLKNNWQEYVSHIQVDTPDPDMNTMVNHWNQYQTSVTFQFSRDASYYHGGLLFGRGYRDSCQDLMGPVIPRPDWARQRILEMASHQFFSGATLHCYYPLTGGGERTGHSDTPLWLPLAIITYLKETGKFDLLEEVVTFEDGGSANLQEHLFGAIEFTLANLSPRKLALFGPGDWNDTLDYLGRGGKGESVWVTMFLAYILRETTALCAHLGLAEREAHYRKWHHDISEALNTHCWDGQWYIRGTKDNGEVIGSSTNEEGRIFLNTQSWAVISGVADNDRAVTCMKSVAEQLETSKGPKILHPAYTKVDANIGLATRCVPGKKENGAVFNHPVSWSILAECLLGHGDRAYEIYRKALPFNPVVDIDRYEVEPYVYAEYVTSPDHPTFGQASHSWLTGSSVWMLRDALDYILGIQPEFGGLRINPCIPAHWPEYRVKRTFRGKSFNIHVQNPEHVSTGVQQIMVNGSDYSGRVLDPALEEFQNSPEINVEVILG